MWAAVIFLPHNGRVSAAEPPRIEPVGLVAPNVIGLTITAGHVEYGRQIPYVKQAGDVVVDAEMHRFVRRGDKIIGTLVGKNADLLCTMDVVVGDRFDIKWSDQRNSYSVIPPTIPIMPPLKSPRRCTARASLPTWR